MKLNELTIEEAREGLEQKKFSALELTQACLNQIKNIDHKIKAFITVSADYAIEQAKRADKLISKDKNIFIKMPLLGIPGAIKDNFCTDGIKTTAASRVLENYVPVYDATAVSRLKKAGAVILGKTNLDAWAHGSSTETSDFFTTRNPWDLNRLPGGSSGGSAAAVISDQCIFSIGSETAGSIRQPASWCGVTGFKPTYGRVSRYGLISMASSTDSPGPITKSAYDSALVLEVLAGHDKSDATSSARGPEKYVHNLDLKKKYRIGIPKQYFLKQMDEEVTVAVKKGIKELESLGMSVKEVNLMDPKYSVAVYTIIQRAEVSSNLGRYDGIRFGNDRRAFGDEAKNRMMLGTYALSAGFYDKYYQKAQKVRTLINKDFERVFQEVDLLAAPGTPTPALELGASRKSFIFGELMDILFEASSLCGLAGISLPCGFSKDKLPIGMQLIGPQDSEGLLMQVGNAYQEVTGWHKERVKIKDQK